MQTTSRADFRRRRRSVQAVIPRSSSAQEMFHKVEIEFEDALQRHHLQFTVPCSVKVTFDASTVLLLARVLATSLPVQSSSIVSCTMGPRVKPPTRTASCPLPPASMRVGTTSHMTHVRHHELTTPASSSTRIAFIFSVCARSPRSACNSATSPS